MSHCVNLHQVPCVAREGVAVYTVPILTDNYSYFIVDKCTKNCMVVDPAEPQVVLDAAKNFGLEIKCLLTTHCHLDHAGGNAEMAKRLPGLEVLGSTQDQIPAMTKAMKDGDKYKFGALSVTALEAPCHTRGHLLYLVEDPQDSQKPLLFSGDTLFLGGCGRFFEGNAADMCANVEKMAKLPDETLLFCGHEYSAKNLAFALTVEPNNEDLKLKYEWVQSCNKERKPSIPSTLKEEKSYNPFMRYKQQSLATATNKTSPEQVMAQLRRMKDSF